MTSNEERRFEVGDTVKWICKPFAVPGGSFEVVGIITALKESTFGGRRRDTGAHIKTKTPRYLRYKGEKAFVSVSKLTKIC